MRTTLVLIALLARCADCRRASSSRDAQPAPVLLEGWSVVQQRYLRPAGQGLHRTRALARVVALRALASAKGRVLSAGWLPWGSAEALRVSTRSVRDGLQVCAHPSAFPDRQLLFVPLSIACSATCAALLAVASVLRAGELLSRCAVSVASDLAQQASLYARVSAAISNGRFGSPVPLPEPPPPEPEPQAYQWKVEPPAGASAAEQQDSGSQPAATASVPRDRSVEHDGARGHAVGDEASPRAPGEDVARRDEPQQPARGRRRRRNFQPMQWLRHARGGSPDPEQPRRED